jgi:hypothetical protein
MLPTHNTEPTSQLKNNQPTNQQANKEDWQMLK